MMLDKFPSMREHIFSSGGLNIRRIKFEDFIFVYDLLSFQKGFKIFSSLVDNFA